MEIKSIPDLHGKIPFQKRGKIAKQDLGLFNQYDKNSLMALLKSGNPQERTCAAILLGRKKIKDAIPELCQRLKTEKYLYTKIAISEALGEIGPAAISDLMLLIGTIGNNQHQTLPEKYFSKINYPLPRDIVARTITKIKTPALPSLTQLIVCSLEKTKVSEAVDALGWIIFYNKTGKTQIESAENALFQCLENFTGDMVIHWKVIRAFESFNSPKVIEYLQAIVDNELLPSQLRSEACRSLNQIKNV